MSIVLHTLQNISEKCSGICRLLPRGEWPYFIILIYIYQVDFCQSGAHKHHLVTVHSNTLHDAKNMHLLVNKYQSCIDSNDDSLNSSHQFPWHTLTYMTILQIPVICFPDIRWLIWRFFEFQSYAFPAFVDLYGNSSNSSHQFTRHLLTCMAILRILVHRFVNNYTNRVGCGFECAGIKTQA